MKRVLVAGMHHESNSFNPIIASERDFNVIYGEDIFNHFRDNDSVTGVTKTLQQAGYEVIPTVFARAVPNGEVDYDFYMKIKNEIIQRAKAAEEERSIDAITLSLHGSMRVKELGEAEGYFLEELRTIFPKIPIFSSLDMHSTMTKRMHNNCDGFVGYKCAPHTDCFETGEHAAKMTIDTLENNAVSKTAWVKVPILIAGEQSATSVEPMIELINTLRECEKKEGIMAASYLMGFPWADNEDSSIAVYVVANDLTLAQREAVRLAEIIWSKKDEFCFHTETYNEKEALCVAFEAVKEGKLPIYVSDSGDNPTAGASSDGTGFLKLLMEDSRTDTLKKSVIYGGIYDPIATKQCEGQVGKRITLTFGSKFDAVTSTPITATGIVKAYIKDWSREGMPKGDLVLFNSCGVDIVIAEVHVGYIVPEMFTDLGADPSEAEIVVCKLGYLTQQHSLVAKRSIMALTKGNTNEDLRKLDYRKVKRPIFPLDSDFEFKALDNLIVKGREKMILEVCVDSYKSMITARSAGADRIELCSSLNIGGLTPSYGLMKEAKKIDDIEIFVMIRPRSGDFLYDDNEFETMKNDINIAKQMGFDGIVTGILLSDGRIDVNRMREVVKIADPLKVVLHRAFDDAKDPIKDIPSLIEMGICRILTSGQRSNALEGADYIAKLQESYGDAITIMPGCGVKASNIEMIYKITQCTNYHLSGKVNDGSQMIYRECMNRMNTPASEFVLERADYSMIKNARDVIDSISHTIFGEIVF